MSSTRTSTDLFTLFSNQTQQSNTGMQSEPIIKEEWINSLLKKIRPSYEYPKEDIDSAYINNTNKNDTYHRHNPFNLRLPYQLESYERLYDHSQIKRNENYYGSSLSKSSASFSYLKFIKEYNLAYIIFLQAINGSEQAATQLKKLFTTNEMFLSAGINMKALSEKVDKPIFLLGLLAYLTLNIVFSKENDISTAARIKALEFVRINFNVEEIAKGFEEFHLGYYPYDVKDEPVYDMIPRRFVTNPNESGGTPHNELFLKNTKIKAIFQIDDSDYNRTINLDHGISVLLNNHPSELAQILQSLLRCGSRHLRIDFKHILVTLISLSNLDGLQKGEIFGSKASFRNNGESQHGLEARVGWAIGTQNFGDYVSEDELNNLSKEELKTRIRQGEYRIRELEFELVNMEKTSVLRDINIHNDPKGYFAILLIHPKTPEENFEKLLTRNYRVLALQYHPDKPTGNDIKFKELNEAYKFLLNTENRKSYRAYEYRSAYGNTF